MNELIELMTEIRDLLRENNTLLRENLTAAKTLAERRAKEAAKKYAQRHREENVSEENVPGQTLTENEERKEAGEKEKSPLNPLKGKEGEEKREAKETLNPRARKELFDAFWTAYPTRRRTNKSKCFDKYTRILKLSKTPRKLADEIQSGLERMKRHPDWTKEGGEFVPMPLTFLNQERWIVEEPESPRDSVRALAERLMREMEEPKYAKKDKIEPTTKG